MIDLRSDTITRPSDAMRRAMSEAAVGDDVYHDDPTVNELEEVVAGILGLESAMYLPSGTMSNQIAVRCHTQPGDTVLLDTDAHIGRHELGGAAHHSGVTLARLGGIRGIFSAEQVRSEIPTPHPSLPQHLYDPVTLLCVENTHNEGGGTIWPIEGIDEVTAEAREGGLACHLDGARIWNASAASGIAVARYARPFDTVSVCFSKGLGAPIGSALVGSEAFIAEARRFKHMFGGGFRQAGIVAAGALFAVRNNRERLIEDHTNARRFAESIADLDGVDVDLESVETNIVYFDTPDAGAVVDRCLDNGVAMLTIGQTRVRAVFHLDVDDVDTSKAIDVIADIVG